jgi:hypothetical protein
VIKYFHSIAQQSLAAAAAQATFEVEDNTRYYGDVIAEYKRISSLDECYLLCAENNPVCMYFVYRKVWE